MNISDTENIPNSLAARCSTSANTDHDSEEPSISSRTTADINELEESRAKTRNTFTLEVPVLLLFISWNLTATVFQNQILYQSCTNSLHYNETVCSQLTNDIITVDLEVIEEEIETYAAKIFMCRAILESIIPAFISLLIGPWSDKYGRRPILLSTFLGYFLAYFVLTLISVISSSWQISPWFYLFAFIPLSLLGGTCALITGIFCYINDVSSQRDRAFRMARMEAAVFVGLLIGSLSSAYMYKATSASFVFGCAASCTFIALTLLYIFVDESIRNISTESRWVKFKALFQTKHVVDIFHTCFRRRERHARALIWLTIATLAATIFIMEGSVTLSYLFMREKFKWMISDYNLYSATNVVMQVFGNILGTYVLSKMLGIPEIVIAIVGYCSAMTEYIIAGLAAYSWQLYIASAIVMLKGVAVPMCRAFLANIVPTSEIGKIYAITTSMESLSPILSAPVYTIIYSCTVDTYPGAFNFFSAAVYLLCALMILIVYLVYRRRPLDVSYAEIES